MNSTQNTADTGPTTLWNRGFLMILVFGFMTGTAGQMVGPLLSKYTISLGASLALAGSLVGLINVVAAIIRPIGGAAADRLNRKHVMIFALVLYALAYTGFLLFPAIPAIVICRILQGAGASLLGIARIAFSTEFIPKDRMGEGITLNSFGIVISQALGPGIGLAISDRWGFQACFLIAVICNALGIIIISTLPYKPTKIAEKRRLQLRSLIEPKIIPYGILSGMLSILTSMATTFVPLIGDERGIPNVALFFTTYAILALILRPVTGRLLDRYGLAVQLFPAYVFAALCFLFLGTAQTIVAILLAAACKTLSQGIALPSIQGYVIKKIGKEHAGVATATILTVQDLFGWAAPTAGGFIATAIGYKNMFFCYAAFVLLGIPFYLLVRAAEQKHP